MARLILDTGILIAASRGRLADSDVGVGDDVAVPAIVVAEYLNGVLLARDPEAAARQRRFLDNLLAQAPAVDYTVEVAAHHAELLAHCRRTGTPRGAHDLIIAACARASGRTLLSRDQRARWADLPGVDVRLVG